MSRHYKPKPWYWTGRESIWWTLFDWLMVALFIWAWMLIVLLLRLGGAP